MQKLANSSDTKLLQTHIYTAYTLSPKNVPLSFYISLPNIKIFKIFSLAQVAHTVDN